MSSVARMRRLMRTLHFLERGKIDGTLAVSCGLERMGSRVSHETYGVISNEIGGDEQVAFERVGELVGQEAIVLANDLVQTGD